jgi:hypothetical protein
MAASVPPFSKYSLTTTQLTVTITSMKQKLEQLKIRAVSLIKHPTLVDPTILARLAPILTKIQYLEGQQKEIEDEISRIDKFLQDCSHSHEHPETAPAHGLTHESLDSSNGRREQKKIRVEIDLSQLGTSGGKKVICEHKASDSLVSFLVLLYRIKGLPVLEKLSKFSINRGVLVSKNPRTDYRYQSGNGEAEYQYQPISDSGFFALTQSATKEKITDIRKVWQFLNLPSYALKVEETNKFQTLSIVE